MVIVDAISSLGAEPMKMSAWGVDIVVAGSQKGLATPPGLSFVGYSARAQQRWSTRPRFYFDLKNEIKSQEKGQTCFTPASGLILALEASLKEISEYGVEEYVQHHEKLAQGVRRALRAMGLVLLAEGCFSNGLTAAFVPEGIDGTKLLSKLHNQRGMIFAGGQDQLAGKIVRFSHLGMVDYYDICAGVIALEQGLSSLGWHNNVGAGISAFLQ
jgi:aspartate aminotransferase-like enzyme